MERGSGRGGEKELANLVQSLGAIFNGKEARIAELGSVIEALKADIANRDRQIEDLHAQIGVMQDEMSELRGSMSGQNNEINALKGIIAGLEAQLAFMRQPIEGLKELVYELKGDEDDAHTRLAPLSEEMKNLEKDLARRKGQIQAVGERVSVMTKLADGMGGDVEVLESDGEFADQDPGQLRHRLLGLQELIQEFTKTRENASAAVNLRETRMAELRAAYRRQEEAIALRQARITEISRLIELLQDRCKGPFDLTWSVDLEPESDEPDFS